MLEGGGWLAGWRVSSPESSLSASPADDGRYRTPWMMGVTDPMSVGMLGAGVTCDHVARPARADQPSAHQQLTGPHF